MELKISKYAVFLKKSAIFNIFAALEHFIFWHLPAQFEKVTEAFEMKFGPKMPCRVFYKSDAVFFEKKIFGHFVSKNLSFLVIFS